MRLSEVFFKRSTPLRFLAETERIAVTEGSLGFSRHNATYRKIIILKKFTFFRVTSLIIFVPVELFGLKKASLMGIPSGISRYSKSDKT